jgi:heat shock protein HslJ
VFGAGMLALGSLACSEKPSAQPPAAASAPAAGPEAAAASPQAESPGVAASELWGTSWVLEDLAGTPSIEGVQPTLEFPEPGRVAGMGSCNRFFGLVEVSEETIIFKGMGSTRMACGAEIGRQETAYLKALQDAQRFELEGDTLLIHAQDLEKPLRFKAKAQ